MTIKETAKILRYSHRGLYRLLENGVIKAKKNKEFNVWEIDETQFPDWVLKGEYYLIGDIVKKGVPYNVLHGSIRGGFIKVFTLRRKGNKRYYIHKQAVVKFKKRISQHENT